FGTGKIDNFLWIFNPFSQNENINLTTLQLVDRADHASRHLDYHANGVGGRNTWGGGTRCR
ncbi:hypothetical protein ACCD04_30845, partial [Telluria sp. Tellsp131]